MNLSEYFSNFIAGTFFLIFVYLVAKNYPAWSSIMKAGGPQVINFVKALQGR